MAEPFNVTVWHYSSLCTCSLPCFFFCNTSGMCWKVPGWDRAQPSVSVALSQRSVSSGTASKEPTIIIRCFRFFLRCGWLPGENHRTAG